MKQICQIPQKSVQPYRNTKEEDQDSHVSFTWVPDKWPLGWGYFLPQSCNLNVNDTSNGFQPIGLLVQEKKFKIEFQEGNSGSHLEFPVRIFLAIFNLQAIQILPIKFGVNSPYNSGIEAQNRFSRWRLWLSWISNHNNFSYFWSTSHRTVRTKYPVSWPYAGLWLVNFSSGRKFVEKEENPNTPSWKCHFWAFQIKSTTFCSWKKWSQKEEFLWKEEQSHPCLWVRSRSSKQIFKMVAMVAILDFLSKQF